jgi:hypothetical protein
VQQFCVDAAFSYLRKYVEQQYIVFRVSVSAALCQLQYSLCRPHCATSGTVCVGRTVPTAVQSVSAALCQQRYSLSAAMCQQRYSLCRPYCASFSTVCVGRTVPTAVQSVSATLCQQPYSLKPQDEVRHDSPCQTANLPLCLCTTTWRNATTAAIKH